MTKLNSIKKFQTMWDFSSALSYDARNALTEYFREKGSEPFLKYLGAGSFFNQFDNEDPDGLEDYFAVNNLDTADPEKIIEEVHKAPVFLAVSPSYAVERLFGLPEGKIMDTWTWKEFTRTGLENLVAVCTVDDLLQHAEALETAVKKAIQDAKEAVRAAYDKVLDSYDPEFFITETGKKVSRNQWEALMEVKDRLIDYDSNAREDLIQNVFFTSEEFCNSEIGSILEEVLNSYEDNDLNVALAATIMGVKFSDMNDVYVEYPAHDEDLLALWNKAEQIVKNGDPVLMHMDGEEILLRPACHKNK